MGDESCSAGSCPLLHLHCDFACYYVPGMYVLEFVKERHAKEEKEGRNTQDLL